MPEATSLHKLAAARPWMNMATALSPRAIPSCAHKRTQNTRARRRSFRAPSGFGLSQGGQPRAWWMAHGSGAFCALEMTRLRNDVSPGKPPGQRRTELVLGDVDGSEQCQRGAEQDEVLRLQLGRSGAGPTACPPPPRRHQRRPRRRCVPSAARVQHRVRDLQVDTKPLDPVGASGVVATSRATSPSSANFTGILHVSCTVGERGLVLGS